MSGWIKIHRSLLDWEWYNDLPVRVTFMHLLLKANWENKEWKNHVIKRGQLVIGSIKTAEEIGITRQQFRTAIKKLENSHQINTKSTNKNTIVTIVKYEDYQERKNESTSNQPANQPAINQPPNQPITTTKEDNNINKYIYTNPKGEIRSIQTDKDFLNLWNSIYTYHTKKPCNRNILSHHNKSNLEFLKKSFGIHDFISALNGLFNNSNYAFTKTDPTHFLNVENFQNYLTANKNKIDLFPEKKISKI